MMKRTIPIWREKVAAYGDKKGTEEWARHDCDRYHCPECGYPLFRAAQRCRNCKVQLADVLDGTIEFKKKDSDDSSYQSISTIF